MSNPNAAIRMFCSDPDPTCPGLDIPGWMTPDELRFLNNRAKQMYSIVEVGSLAGRSTAALLGGCKGVVYAIDPWSGDSAGVYDQFVRNVGKYQNLIIVQGLSPEVGRLVDKNPDMTFLDGNHVYDAVMEDLKYWFPRTCKLLCGHDINHPDYPGVAKAVYEYFDPKGIEIEIVAGASIWYVEIS